MKLGNYLASIGIILRVLGFLMLPLYNFQELPFWADSGYAKGGGWKLVAQSGILKYPGLYMVLSGGIFYFIAKLLPGKYWQTPEDLLEEEIEAGKKKKKN